MTKCTHSARLLGVALLAATYLAACGSDRDDGNGTIKKNKDASVEEADSGVPVITGDSGIPTTMDTGVASNDDAGGMGGGDGGGMGNRDGGGMGNDGGMTTPGCTTSAQCTAPNNTCLDTTTGEPCAGGTCGCFQSCAFESPASGCAAGNRCTWLGTASTVPGQGICVPSNGGVAHGGSCTAQFDAQGNLTADNCEVGNYCIGAFPEKPTGKCSQFCNPQSANNCTGLATYTCDNLGDPAGRIGLCLVPSIANDNGEACTAANTCTGGSCEQGFGGMCTEDCTDPLQTCSNDSICLYVAQDFSLALCLRSCVSGAAGGPGDTFCTGVNMNLICENVSTTDPMAGVCIPRCTMDAECGAAGCNETTGHCN